MNVICKGFVVMACLSQPANGSTNYGSTDSRSPSEKPLIYDYVQLRQLCGNFGDGKRDICLPPFDNQHRPGKTPAASISPSFRVVDITHMPHDVDPNWTRQLTLVLDILNEFGLDVSAERLPALYVNVYTPNTGKDPALPKYVMRGELRCLDLPETAYDPIAFTHEALHFVFDSLKQPNSEKHTDKYKPIIQSVEAALDKLEPSDFGRFPVDIIKSLNRLKQDPVMQKTYYSTRRALAEEYIVILTTSLIVSDSRVSKHQRDTLKKEFNLQLLIRMFLNPPEKSEL